MRFEISLHTKSSIVVIKVSIQVLRMWRDKMSRNDQIHTYVKKKQCSHFGTDISVTFRRTVWNTVDHLSSLKTQSLVERQNIIVISLQVP